MMARAIKLAQLNAGLTGKNPSVGCVLVSDGVVVAEDVTSIGGEQHAEELAFKRQTQPLSPHSDVYVTLEPCRTRTDKTKMSCADWILQARPRRVIVSVRDPHPTARGGIEKLRQAGIIVDTGLKRADALPLYQAFFKEVLKKTDLHSL